MSLADLTQKPVYTVQPEDTVARAARLMCDHGVGALVIVIGTGTQPASHGSGGMILVEPMS